jgi:precorrin-3B synthase
VDISRDHPEGSQGMRLGDQFCPGVLHAIPARDGLLVRVRLPGGLIAPHQLRVLADLACAVGDGTLEITSRANLQLRAIRDRDLEHLVEKIIGAGLLPSSLHDRVRNIVTSPLAGLDVAELVDPRPLVDAFDRRLTGDPVFAGLHPKFSFGIYGGSRRFSRDTDDISIEATGLIPGSYFALSMGGVATGYVVSAEDAVDCMSAAASMCMELAKEAGVPVRGKAVTAAPGAMKRITDALSHLLTPSPFAFAVTRVEQAPWGLHPTPYAGRVSIIPSVPLGRLTTAQADCLAEVATEFAGDLRLAGWRGVVLGAVHKAAADLIVGRLEAAGLSCEGRDGFLGLAACAGSHGCDASLANVRADAASLAQQLCGRTAPMGWTVNLSGCEKRCGRRHEATAELIAGPAGYILYLGGALAESNCSPETAVHAIAALHQDLMSKGASK